MSRTCPTAVSFRASALPYREIAPLRKSIIPTVLQIVSWKTIISFTDHLFIFVLGGIILKMPRVGSAGRCLCLNHIERDIDKHTSISVEMSCHENRKNMIILLYYKPEELFTPEIILQLAFSSPSDRYMYIQKYVFLYAYCMYACTCIHNVPMYR